MLPGAGEARGFLERVCMDVRAATAGDVPAILGLIRELAAYEQLSAACVASEELLTRHLFGAERAAEALVAEAGGGVVAYAIYFKTFSTFLARPWIYLEDLYVTPEARGIIGSLIPDLSAIEPWNAAATEAAIRAFAEKTQAKLGSVAQPLRAALTGRTTSPGIFEVLVALGKDESIARLRDQA